MIFFFSFPATGSLEFRDFWVFSFFRFFLFFFCVFSVSFVFFSRNSRVSQVSRGVGGTAEESPHKKLADASEKRATDVAHKKTKKLPYIWVAEWFFFFSLYSIYRACYLFQISPPCLPMLSGGCFVW